MKRLLRVILPVVFVALGAAPAAWPEAFVDAEGGPAFTGYNDLAIPADTGTKVSLKDDLVPDPALALRLRLGYTFSGRHTVSALIAPLTIRGSGTLGKDVTYRGKTFEKGTSVQSVYRFDSYRLTYRYAFVDSDDIEIAAGITGKVRSADIALMSDEGYAHRSDLGVVPLVNFSLRWNFAKPFSLLLDADALASLYGRAEDVLLAVQYEIADGVTGRIGYRILEGGSDGGGNVYTFALINYATAGISVSF